MILLNFCVENGTKSTNRGVVFATQPTISRGLNSRHRHDDTNTSTCQYASQQCKADGYNPPKWEPRPQSLVSIFFYSMENNYSVTHLLCVNILRAVCGVWLISPIIMNAVWLSSDHNHSPKVLLSVWPNTIQIKTTIYGI